MTKNLKKMLCVALAIVALVLLVTMTCIGCSSGDVEETTVPTETSVPVETTEATETATETTEVTEVTTAPTEAPEETTVPATEPAETEAPKQTSSGQSGNKGNQGGNQNNQGSNSNKEETPAETTPLATEAPKPVETQPAETTPPATEAPKPVETQPVETTPPATEAPMPVETQPAETYPPETEHQHNWEMKWYPEEGHYGQPYVHCDCGAKLENADAWVAHTKAITDAVELMTNHASYSWQKDWIIDSPEHYEWHCSCGAVTTTQP